MFRTVSKTTYLPVPSPNLQRSRPSTPTPTPRSHCTRALLRALPVLGLFPPADASRFPPFHSTSCLWDLAFPKSERSPHSAKSSSCKTRGAHGPRWWWRNAR